jgi:hypothetical protein
MSKRTTFTSITPLPKTVTRSAAINWLHNHVQMIRLNPLVIRLQETTPPPNAAADEYNCSWYEITDEISYLPGGLYKGEVTYKACFNDLPNGTQTHTFAPAGLDLRGKWTVGGNEPGEPRETLELGMDVPREGLYVREDVDMRCNIFLTGFVKKNLTKSHKSVVDKLASLGDGHDQVGDEDELAHQGHGYGVAGVSSAPKSWHNNDRPLTPVDSNTMFSPDSYLRDSAHPQPVSPQHEDLSYADTDSSVGQRPSSYKEKSRSHLHSHMYNPGAEPARSAPRLSYREHERIRDIAPQIPPLDFLHSDAPRDSHPVEMPNGRTTSTGQASTADSARLSRDGRPPSSLPRDPSEQSESRSRSSYTHISTQTFGTSSRSRSGYAPAQAPHDVMNAYSDRRDEGGKDNRGAYAATTDAGAFLNPGPHATTQRLSSDSTWRPGSRQDAFI